jgi:hypothetical protein
VSNNGSVIDDSCPLHPSKKDSERVARLKAVARAYLNGADLGTAASLNGLSVHTVVETKHKHAWSLAREAVQTGRPELAKRYMVDGARPEERVLRYVSQLEEVVANKLAVCVDDHNLLKPMDLKYMCEALERLLTLRRRLSEALPAGSPKSEEALRTQPVDTGGDELDEAGGVLPL